MNPHPQLEFILTDASFGRSPEKLSLDGPNDEQLILNLTTADNMSCAFSEVQLFVPALAKAENDKLTAWAEQLASRVTYLLEDISFQELDADAGQLLMRSRTPDSTETEVRYYEAFLKVTSEAGVLHLKRYAYTKGEQTREPLELIFTREMLFKFVNDLFETLPVERPKTKLSDALADTVIVN